MDEERNGALTGALGLWQGSNWTKKYRAGFVTVYLIITIPAFAPGDAPAKGIVSWAVLTAVIAALYEWRARNMGLRIDRDGITLVRPLNRTRLLWTEIDGFFVRGATDRRRTIHVHRRQFIGLRVPKRVGLQVPTFDIVPQHKRLDRWLGPCDLICRERRVAEPEVLDFLNGLLQA